MIITQHKKPKVDTKPVTTKVETPVVEEDDTLIYFEKLLSNLLRATLSIGYTFSCIILYNPYKYIYDKK